MNPSSKISSASGPNIFARPSPSSSFGGSSTSSYILLLSSFCNAFFISSFSLVNVYVCEPYKLFEGVNAGGGESGGADGAGGMPIKSFGLSAGGGLGCAIDHWNGSGNFPDGSEKNGGAGEGPNGACGSRGGDGRGDKLKLSWSSFGSGLFFNLFNVTLSLASRCSGVGAF